ncbi:unnamed protein product, partial [Oppiella nova]
MYGFYWAVISVDRGRIFLDFNYPSRSDTSPQTLWYLYLGWLFMISRLMDLLDTVFMVLRKRDLQISALHMYHHTVVPVLCWVSFKYNAMIPIIRMFVLINTGIHTLMYGYYALAALGPRVRPYLQWKRYLTVLQIAQFVICGPKLMANRKPFSLRWLMFAYNVLMAGTNAFFFLLSIKWLDNGRRLLEFQFPSRDDTSPQTLRYIDVGMAYGCTKFIDLLDTIFLVLRKKESHLTFLHLYHHFMVPILTWLTMKFAPTCPPTAIFAVLNTPVHTMMYSYYALSALGPTVHRFLWWK